MNRSGDGTSFAVGAIYRVQKGMRRRIEKSTDSNPGLVRVYKKSSTNGSYDIVGADIIGANNGDNFGPSVSMSGNGATVIVGAPYNENLKGENSGHVRLYRDTTVSSAAPTTNPTSIPTAAPTKAPTASPTKAPRAATTKAPSKAPVFVISPTKTPIASIENCGFFGWNLFCPRTRCHLW